MKVGKYFRKLEDGSFLELQKATITPNTDGSMTAAIEGVKTDNQAFAETIKVMADKIPTN